MYRLNCVVAVCFSVFASSTCYGQWEQFQGNAQHTGVANSTINASSLRSAWSADAPDFNGVPADLSVSIVDNYVYATMRVGSFSDGTYFVRKYDGTHGTLDWSTTVLSDAGVVSAPSIFGNTVYLHQFGHSSSVGTTTAQAPALIGLSTTDGVQQFRTTHPGQWSSGSRPTIQDGTVLAAGGYYGGLDSYNLDGSHNWFHELNQQDDWIPAADGNNVYVFMGEASASPGPSVGSLFVVDMQTGNPVATILDPLSQSRSLEQSVMLGTANNAFAVTGVTGSYSLSSFDLIKQEVNWRENGSGNPAVANGYVYLPAGNVLKVLDEITGDIAWTWAGYGIDGNVVLTDKYAFVNSNGSVHGIDLLTHESVWNSGGIGGNIALDQNVLVISNQNGVFAFVAVPEPMSASCVGVGLIAAIAYRRVRKSTRSIQT